jgi:uncharacterized cupredoxin-like copper-binding protein
MKYQKGLMKRWLLLGWSLPILLAALTACGGTTPSVVTVQTTLSDFKIESSLTKFAQGVPYHFVITNKGTQEHEFLLAPPMTEGMTMEDVDRQRLFEVEEIAAGETKTFDFTFKSAASAGMLEFSCHLPGHYESGMKLEIVVE